MKVLVTGAKGLLGSDIVSELIFQKHTVIALDKEEMNILNQQTVNAIFAKELPDIVIHCAAYTNTDQAESDRDRCYALNVDGTQNIVNACIHNSSKLVFFSSDYIFDGNGELPYLISDKPAPLSIYGKSKWQAEQIIMNTMNQYFIVRTSWIFGKNGKNFVNTMLQLAQSKKELTVVNDQVGSPTYSKDLATLIAKMITTNHFGTYHATNSGFCSWYEFAREIFNCTHTTIDVKPISTDEYPSHIKRPLNSRLDKQSLLDAGFGLLPTWQDALNRYLIAINMI